MQHSNDIDLGRYSRQTMLREIGEEGQRKLLSSSVVIVGLGGLGAAVATYLTGAGVGRIGLCDPDIVSLSNLQRQVLYTESPAEGRGGGQAVTGTVIRDTFRPLP